MTRVTMVELLAPLLAIACSLDVKTEEEPSTGPGAVFDLAQAKVIDLSHSYNADTLYWPTSPSSFELETLHHGPTEAGYFYSASSFCTPEHGGTHLDAPIHFAEGGWTSEQIPIDRLVGPAVVIDVSERARADADYLASVADLGAWEAEYGTVPEDSIVLLRTGWGSFWPDRRAVFGDDTAGDASNLHFPSYGEELARVLVEERRVAVLGVDTPSIDHGPSQYFLVHQIANGANVPGLENVANLDRLPPVGSWVFALPMKIAGGSGGPVRIVALIGG